ncbi:MAG: FAD-binding protein [Gemmatimonadetes bacterium]|nr:FAD-binding protein [Gemmatimonadota bacterium]
MPGVRFGDPSVDPAVPSALRDHFCDRFSDSIEQRIGHAYDGTPLRSGRPLGVLRPASVEDVVRLVGLASDLGFSIVPRGAGTGLSGGSIPDPRSVVLVMSGWNRILEIDEENLCAWVQPGVVTADLHRAVEARGLFYPPDPGSMNVCTIGGNVAENSGGLRGLKYGVTKDYVLGLEAVLATGEVYRGGGKSVKDVAGYNLVDLLVGSEGTLGVITRVLVRLVPRPETSATLLALYPSVAVAARTVTAILSARIVPATLEFLDRTTLRCVEAYARLGLPGDAGALLLIEVDGRAAVVAEDAARIEAICSASGATHVIRAADEVEALRLKTARRAAFASLARLSPTTILEDATVPRSALPEMVAAVERIAAKHDLVIGNFGHAGDGNLHPTCCIDGRDPDQVARAHRAFEEIFRTALDLGGTITGEHGVGLSKKAYLPDAIGAGGMRWTRALKRALDPAGILNPGKIFDPDPSDHRERAPFAEETVPACERGFS